MSRLLKFALEVGASTIVRTGRSVAGPRFLAVDWQDDDLVVWAEATPADDFGLDETELVVRMTGQEAPTPSTDFRYIGTAHGIVGGHRLVAHVYERVRA